MTSPSSSGCKVQHNSASNIQTPSPMHTHNAKLVKITATTLCAKWFFERDLYILHIVSIPNGAEEDVSEFQNPVEMRG